MPADPEALRYLPALRARADELRADQDEASWQELRRMVTRLLARMVCDQCTKRRMIGQRPGVGMAACVAFSDHEAALRVEDGVFWISSPTPWTALREAGTWCTPQDPDIVLIYASAPPGTVLH